jgi:hypothetical protein
MILKKRRTPLKLKLQIKFLQLRKKIYHLTHIWPAQQKVTFFVVGCQRSGTNMLARIFERDFDTVIYHEHHPKVVYLHGEQVLRLKPLDLVKRVIDQQRAPVAILKPLVETQNTLKLLDYFEDSKAMWLYRHYKDVADSNLKNFGIGNGINNLRPIVKNDPENWRSEHISPQVRNVVLEHFSEEMNPHDAAALFWFVRNSFFFELKLNENPRILMCRYEELVTDPADNIKKVYRFIGRDFPGEKIVEEVKTTSVGKGKRVDLSPQIERLCQELLEKIDMVYAQKERIS